MNTVEVFPAGPFTQLPCPADGHDWVVSKLRMMINPPLETRLCTVCGIWEEGRWSADLLGDKPATKS